MKLFMLSENWADSLNNQDPFKLNIFYIRLVFAGHRLTCASASFCASLTSKVDNGYRWVFLVLVSIKLRRTSMKQQPTDNATTSSRWVFPLLLLCATLCWCYFETLALMDTRGRAVGFHPCVIFAAPFAGLISLVLILFACVNKSLAIGLCSILPILLLGLPIFYAYDLGIYAWSKEIRRNSNVNSTAIANTDFSGARFVEIPYKDHQRMVGISGFQWSNANEMTATKNGVFFGFELDTVPHVYICPLVNGARGVAWVIDSSKINNAPNVKYEYTGVDNWYIWTLSA